MLFVVGDHALDRVLRVEQSDLVRDLEIAAPRREDFGDREHAAVGIELSNDAAVAADRREHDFDSVLVAKKADQRAVHVGAVKLSRRHHTFGCAFEIRKVIEIGLNDVVDFL